ncbi:uncharacterized protein LOC143179364 isoform X2 [Calliopsis andreniformis]
MTNQNEDKYSNISTSAAQINIPPEVKTVTSSPIFRPTHQTSRPIPSSSSKLFQPMQNTYYENRHQNMQPRIPNRHLNDSQSNIQIHPAIQRNSIELSQNLPIPGFQQRQSYYKNNARFVSNNLPTDQNSHAQIDQNMHLLTDLRIHTLSQQTIPHFNEPLKHRLGLMQAGLAIPDGTISISPYKSLDAPLDTPARSLKTTASRYIDLPVDSFPHQNTEPLLTNLQTELKNSNDMSPNFRSAMVADRNVSATPSSNPPLTPSKYLQNHSNYSSKVPEYFEKPDIPACSFRTFDDDLKKRAERFTPKLLNSARTSRLGIKQALAEVDEGRATTMTIENELDRYIEKIRKLHRDLDAESLEEIDHEQNTSGDILNASLSDDDLKFSTGEKVPKEVEKVLALADDLASRTVDLHDAKAPEKEGKDENRSLELIRTTRNHRPISEGSPALGSGNREGRAAYAKDRISGDITLHWPELESHENIGKLQERNSPGLGNANRMEQYDQQLPRMEDEHVISAVSSDMLTEQDSKDTLIEKTEGEEYYENIHVAEEVKLEQYTFYIAEELEPWDLDRVEKRVREIELTDIEEESMENESVVESELNEGDRTETEYSRDVDIMQSEADKVEAMNVEEVDLRNADQSQSESVKSLEAEKDMAEKNETEASEISISQDQELEREDGNQSGDEKIQENSEPMGKKLDEQKDSQKEEYNEAQPAPKIDQSNQEEIARQGEEYNDQNYVAETDQTQEYTHNTEAEYANQEYNYDQNAMYGNDQNQEYQGYSNQDYAEGSNEQYEGYANEQYDQYANVSEGQYEQDPNAQYPGDVNQQYAYAYDQQYDPNQVYETDANQPYEYANNYDSNQTESAQGQNDQTEQEQNQDNEEVQEEVKNKETEEALEKVETGQNKDDNASSENEPKKKKDVIKSLLDSDTDSTIERNVSNTESDFDFN